MVSLEPLKDLGSLALASGDDIGELFEQRLAHPVSSSLELLPGGLTDLRCPLGVPRQTTGRNPVRLVTAPVAHRLRARGAPCARQQGRPPPCVGGRNSSDCQRELGRGAGRAKVSNELSNYCSANRRPHLDDPGSFGAQHRDRRPSGALRDKEVTAAVAAIVRSCLTIWPESTCRVSTLSIRRGQHQPQPVFSDLCDPEIESYLAALAAFDASTVRVTCLLRDIRSSASRFFRSASGSAWRYFCVVWIWW